MLRKLYNKIFWRNVFDEYYKNLIKYSPPPWEVSKNADGIRFRWREQDGPRTGLSPEMAAFCAVEEFAVWLVNNKNIDLFLENYLVQQTIWLNYKIPLDHSRYNESIQNFILNDKLYPYWLKYKKERDAERSRTTEVANLRFNSEQIEYGIKLINDGKSPVLVNEIWEITKTAHTIHEISQALNTNIDECGFWIMVLTKLDLIRKLGDIGYSEPRFMHHYNPELEPGGRFTWLNE